MKCVFCGHPRTKVVDKREIAGLEAARRRRECLKCRKRFTTYERVEKPALSIIKKDGARELFNKQKLLISLMKACEKRSISVEKLSIVVDQIESALKEKGKAEIPSKLVGELVLKKLKELDPVAYIRFLSVYRGFDDLEKFEAEIQKLKKAK